LEGLRSSAQGSPGFAADERILSKLRIVSVKLRTKRIFGEASRVQLLRCTFSCFVQPFHQALERFLEARGAAPGTASARRVQ